MEKVTSTLQREIAEGRSRADGLQSKLEEKEEARTSVRLIAVAQVSTTRKVVESNLSETEQLVNTLTQKNTTLNVELQTIRSVHAAEMETRRLQMAQLEGELKAVTASLSAAQAEGAALARQLADSGVEIAGLNAKVLQLGSSLDASVQESTRRQETIEELQTQIEKHLDTILELESKRRQDEMIRRKLHNDIQELKGPSFLTAGNIRVFCRVRPPRAGEESILEFPGIDKKQVEVQTPAVATVSGKEQRGKPMAFAYDRVFSSSASQEEVFEEISHLVQSSLDGYNTCIFAYGQTGSGKTYTMEGSSEDSRDPARGMIPRTVEKIFDSMIALQEQGWAYEMECSYVEIYNEVVRDLLSKQKGEVKHEIHHDKFGNTQVSNLTVVKVETAAQIYRLLATAQQNRAVGATQSNERSSRSHSVFSLRLVGRNSITADSSQGILNLVDLAGSERLDKSGATGDRLKETQSINKSLSCLGDVIFALANKADHIPYRNSKLTYLLQNSLGGNSKTLMFVNISPQPEDFSETISSLRFATKVNSCDIGTAKKQRV